MEKQLGWGEGRELNLDQWKDELGEACCEKMISATV
jgi:hypothetical protein